MAETQRSLAELLANLPDNIIGLIDPEDIRDLVISLQPPYGGLSLNVPAPTAIGVAGTYYKMEGTTTAGNLLSMTSLVDGRLVYTGVSDRHFHVVANISMTCAGNNQILGFRVAKNGVTLPETQVRRFVSTGADVGAASIHADVVLSTDDYLELFVTNYTSTAAPTVEDVYLFAMGMII